MKRFDLIRDEKITIWRRYYVPVEAKTVEAAANKLLAMDDFEAEWYDDLMDTEIRMYPKDNDGLSTVEIRNQEDKSKVIARNGNKEIPTLL
jgi:hypothetical protein